jgi:hypothetical protein
VTGIAALRSKWAAGKDRENPDPEIEAKPEIAKNE